MRLRLVISLIVIIGSLACIEGYLIAYQLTHPPNFEIMVEPSSIDGYQFESPTFSVNVTLKSINGFIEPIQLSIEELPLFFTASFNSSIVTPESNEQISVILTLKQSGQTVIEGTPTYSFMIRATSGPLVHTSNISIQIRKGGGGLKVEQVYWCFSCNKVNIVLKNLSNVSKEIESISFKINEEEKEWYTDRTFDAVGTVISELKLLVWNEIEAGAPKDFLSPSTSYVIRLTSSNGFYYEITATSPKS